MEEKKGGASCRRLQCKIKEDAVHGLLFFYFKRIDIIVESLNKT
jgi:hypothetical protein